MAEEPPEDTTFLVGLNEFWHSEFPKTCPRCTRTYTNFSDLVGRTVPIENSTGLIEVLEQGDKSVGIFRNCVCGSTLMIHGNNRRDTSEVGEKRRQVFGAMLDKLIAANIPREQARQRLLRVFYSGQLEDLAKRLLG